MFTCTPHPPRATLFCVMDSHTPEVWLCRPPSRFSLHDAPRTPFLFLAK